MAVRNSTGRRARSKIGKRVSTKGRSAGARDMRQLVDRLNEGDKTLTPSERAAAFRWALAHITAGQRDLLQSIAADLSRQRTEAPVPEPCTVERERDALKARLSELDSPEARKRLQDATSAALQLGSVCDSLRSLADERGEQDAAFYVMEHAAAHGVGLAEQLESLLYEMKSLYADTGSAHAQS